MNQENGVIQSECEGLRVGADGVSLGLSTRDQDPGAAKNEGRRRWTSPLRQSMNPPFLCLFVQALSRLDGAQAIGEGGLLP